MHFWGISGINSANISIFHFLKWHLIVQYLQFLASVIRTKFTQNTLNSAYNENKPNPGSQYAGTAAGGHEIHILSLMQTSSHSEEGKGCRTLHTVRKEKGG